MKLNNTVKKGSFSNNETGHSLTPAHVMKWFKILLCTSQIIHGDTLW